MRLDLRHFTLPHCGLNAIAVICHCRSARHALPYAVPAVAFHPKPSLSGFGKGVALWCRGVAYEITLSNFTRLPTASWDWVNGHAAMNSRAEIRSLSGTYFVSVSELRRVGEGALGTQNLGTLDVRFSVSNIASPGGVERRLSGEAYRSQASVPALGMTLGFDAAPRSSQSLLSQRCREFMAQNSRSCVDQCLRRMCPTAVFTVGGQIYEVPGCYVSGEGTSPFDSQIAL